MTVEKLIEALQKVSRPKNEDNLTYVVINGQGP